ncbi:Alpha/Beta hydrolase protein [Chytridium lagenaria]|nr:Alpha/Beta hydrolase protein [Chytridium lagenaria]
MGVFNVQFDVDPYQGLDLYFPSDVPKSSHSRMVIFIHGGAWRANKRADFNFIGETFSQQYGLPVAVLGYRLSTLNEAGVPQVRHPSHVSDAAAGIAWILASTVHRLQDSASASEANQIINSMNLKELIVVGHSAGAQMGGIIAFKPSFLEEALFNRFHLWKVEQPDVSPLIKLISGYIGCEGIYDIPQLIEEYPDYKGFVWQAFGNAEDGLWEEGSPARLVPQLPSKQTEFPHHLVLQSLQDELLTPSQSTLWLSHLTHHAIAHIYNDQSLKGKHDDAVMQFFSKE